MTKEELFPGYSTQYLRGAMRELNDILELGCFTPDQAAESIAEHYGSGDKGLVEAYRHALAARQPEEMQDTESSQGRPFELDIRESDRKMAVVTILAALRLAQERPEVIGMPHFDDLGIDLEGEDPPKCLDDIIDVDSLCKELNALPEEDLLHPMTIRDVYGENAWRPLCDKCGRNKAVANLRHANYCPECFRQDVSEQLKEQVFGDYYPCCTLLWHRDGYPLLCLGHQEDHDKNEMH